MAFDLPNHSVIRPDPREHYFVTSERPERTRFYLKNLDLLNPIPVLKSSLETVVNVSGHTFRQDRTRRGLLS